MNSEQIINREAYELGKKVTGSDRALIQDKLGISESAVNVVFTGKRRAIRGKSLQIIEAARKTVEINKAKVELF